MKWLLALLAMTSFSLGIAACGGTGEGASSSNAAAGGGTTTTTTSTTASRRGESKLDRDNDNDNPTASYYDEDDNAVLYYGRATSPAEEWAVARLVKRYYKAAVAADGAAACPLLFSPVAESLPEEYDRTYGPRALHGKTCEAIMSKLFKQHHRLFAVALPKLEVKGARAEGDRGWALVGFGPAKPPGRILMQREGRAWRIVEPLRTEMP